MFRHVCLSLYNVTNHYNTKQKQQVNTIYFLFIYLFIQTFCLFVQILLLTEQKLADISRHFFLFLFIYLFYLFIYLFFFLQYLFYHLICLDL